MLGLLLLAVALVVYGSLYPWEFDFHRAADPVFVLLHSWPHAWSRFIARDIAINVLLYVPLGALALLAAHPRRQRRILTLLGVVAFGFALSVSMELLQVYDDHRDSSLLDVTTNTVGAAVGALLALVCLPAAGSFAAPRAARRFGNSTAVLAACWAGFQFYPLFPVFSQYRLRAALALLWQVPRLGFVEIWTGAAEWFALALVLEALVGTFELEWLAAVMLLLPLRLFIVTRTLGWNDILGAALALVLWSGIPPRRRLTAGLWAVLSAVLLRELAPFQWSPQAAPFTWIPFVPTLESERQSAVVILLRKAFDYGAAVWLLHAAGWRYARAGACVAAALFGLELLQRHLPGRTPEITDAVLAAIMAAALWLASDSRRARGLR